MICLLLRCMLGALFATSRTCLVGLWRPRNGLPSGYVAPSGLLPEACERHPDPGRVAEGRFTDQGPSGGCWTAQSSTPRTSPRFYSAFTRLAIPNGHSALGLAIGEVRYSRWRTEAPVCCCARYLLLCPENTARVDCMPWNAWPFSAHVAPCCL